MDRLVSVRPPLMYGAWKPVAWIGGAIATTVAVAVAALLAVVFAATLVVIGLMASVLVVFTGLALRARRTVRRRYNDVLEARHVGGGSWVAYGWDERAR
ncbi:MAG TPA: hypothetical protein VKT30_15550 [Caulobacteraceae bacterium]|nr:hypothetical protein [Caulobacteraceae bacterium]